MHTSEEIQKWLPAYKELIGKYSVEELLAIADSFDKIRHVLGPFALFLPIMDEEYNTLGALEHDDKEPTKIGPKTNARLKFLLDHYQKALPLIEAGIKHAQKGP